MSDNFTRILDHITTLRHNMLKRPEMFGPLIAVELQYLMLVQIDGVVCGDPPMDTDKTYPNKSWSRILHEHGYLSNMTLADQVKDEADDVAYDILVTLLRELTPCPQCDGAGYEEWLTGCPACGASPPCPVPNEDDCTGPEEPCPACKGSGMR